MAGGTAQVQVEDGCVVILMESALENGEQISLTAAMSPAEAYAFGQNLLERALSAMAPEGRA